MACDYLFSLALQDHTWKYPASCQLLVPKKQCVGKAINLKGSAKVMKSCVDLADGKRLEAEQQARDL